MYGSVTELDELGASVLPSRLHVEDPRHQIEPSPSAERGQPPRCSYLYVSLCLAAFFAQLNHLFLLTPFFETRMHRL